MRDLVLFLIVMGVIIFQRIIELFIARKNEKWMKARGAVEFGREHYGYMVAMHTLFFISLIGEKIIFNREISILWPIFLILFLAAQFLRIWVILSLGKYWNTKIIVLPGIKVVQRGPYRFIKHPNYAIVAIEIAVIPLLFNDYITATLFTLLNIIILSVRIPEEEKALKKMTEYEKDFKSRNRFVPNLLHKYEQ